MPAHRSWSLEPTRRLLDVLGHPEQHFSAIHVGGTNGKGSVCHLVYRALRESGFRTGLYTSPHLVSIRERFIVDDRPIPEAAFTRWTERLLPAVKETGASFFEATTALAFADFAGRGVDIAVVEVGLGGRLDATNVLLPLVSAVVQIALDHADYLGNSLAGIAKEKAGIAKPGRPFVVGESDPALRKILEDTAIAAGATTRPVPAERLYQGPLALSGPHQRRNAAVAEAVLEALPPSLRVNRPQIEQAFSEVTVPGRFDRRGRWIFDVAHNPDGVEALLAALSDAQPPGPVHGLVGILGDKDWRTMLARLGSGMDRLWVTNPPTAPGDRKWNLEAVSGAVGGNTVVEPDFDVALKDFQKGAGTLLVTGSFHTVGDALARVPGFAPLG